MKGALYNSCHLHACRGWEGQTGYFGPQGQAGGWCEHHTEPSACHGEHARSSLGPPASLCRQG